MPQMIDERTRLQAELEAAVDEAFDALSCSLRFGRSVVPHGRDADTARAMCALACAVKAPGIERRRWRRGSRI